MEEDLEEGTAPLLNPSTTFLHSSKANDSVLQRFYAYLDGPYPRQPPEPHRYFQRLQRKLDDSIFSTNHKRSRVFWVAFYLIWFLIFGALVHQNSFASAENTVFIACTSTMWQLYNDCSIDGVNCAPFDGISMEFRCPGACKSEVVLNPRYIGNQVVFHQPLVIGGQGKTANESGIYRGDSFLCASAIHAGVLTDKSGGCGRLVTRGEQTSFTGSEENGIASISFDSVFPKSFSFMRPAEQRGCTDMRWEMTVFNAVFTIIHALLQSSTQTYYWILFMLMYFHIALVSDPPPATGYDLLSVAFEGLLPSAFVGYTFWRVAVRWTLKDAFPFDRMIWLAGLWFGALLNYISVHIPISRLIMSDIMRDGGLFWLIGIVVLLVSIIINQMRIMRKSGDLIYYLKIYLTGLAVLILAAQLPGLSLRIHHYIFGILFIAGTAYPTKLSLLYSGILVGLFLDGIARWGFDSILETPDSLRGDALMDSPVPELNATANWLDLGYLAWTGQPPDNYYYSVLINEVERYRGSLPRINPSRTLDLLPDVPYYIRIAYTFGQQALDYSVPAKFFANGTLVLP